MITNNTVLIAGGGPAGMAAAIVLASRGIDCAIAEPVAVIQPKAGETIPPNARPLFAKLGIEGLLNAHLPCYGNKFLWGMPGEKDFFAGMHGHGWHLNRIYFEAQLREYTQLLGVKWLMGWRVINCKQGWKVSLQNENDVVRELECSFLIDATGRSSRIARSLGIQRTRLDALAGLWCVMDTEEQVKPYYTFIEAVLNGWWYAAPLQNKKLSLAFMTDSDLMDGSGFFQAAHKLSLIGPLVEKIIPGAEPVISPASTSYLNTRVGEGWLAAGDAAFAYDPISSYGIISALEGGFYAGHAIADHYAGNADALPAYDYMISNAFDTYLKMHAFQYKQETRWPGEPFWKRRPLTP